jgi:hypothetical protein
VKISSHTALSEEVRSAVVPPPLCKTCRWCRPAWGNLLLPLFWPFPMVWYAFWQQAKCQHPTSLYRRPADYVTGRREKPQSMPCNAAPWRRSRALWTAGTFLGSAALSSMGLDDGIGRCRLDHHDNLYRVLTVGRLNWELCRELCWCVGSPCTVETCSWGRSFYTGINSK